MSPKTPTIGLDANFSRILQKKREEQLEASRQRLFDSTSKCESMIDANDTQKKSDSVSSVPITKTISEEHENSMMFSKVNKSWNDLSGDEDSFLALERQCNMDDKKERLMNANDTLLFDIEPPSELWNQTVNQSLTVAALEESQSTDTDEDDTIEVSPVKYIGMIRPSTIIEETSSQMESSSKNSSASTSATKSSLYATASMSESTKETSGKSCDLSTSNQSIKNDSKVEALSEQNSLTSRADRQRRGTFAFKRANYTFFPNENLEPINESASFTDDVNIKSPKISKVDTPKHIRLESPIISNFDTPKKDLLNFKVNSKEDDCCEDVDDRFNNTLERVDYLLEKGKQIIEDTPVAKRSSHHQSILETPLFSCKRKRLLSEMASIEMLPLPKRGPLIDFSTPEITNKQRISKFTGN